MIVCSGIARAIDYCREVSDYLEAIKSPYKAIVAYSGELRDCRQEEDRGRPERLPEQGHSVQTSGKTRIAS